MLKKTTTLLFLILLTFSSCAVKKIRYTYDFKTIQQGVDFTINKGTWLLNTIDIPEEKEGRQIDKILKQFNKWTKNNTTLTQNMVSKNGDKFHHLFTKDITKDDLDFLEKMSDYRYLVNVYILKTDTSSPRVSITEMMFDIYDIKNKDLVVSERVIGALDHENPSEIGDIHGFRVEVTPSMISGLIKKGLKRLGKNSKY